VQDLKEYAIETHELTKHYGKLVAVDHISFKVKRGEIFGFLGPNGAGKTTTIKLLTTLIPPTSGGAQVLGFDIVSEGARIRPKIGVVQQEYSFEYALNVEQNLDLYGFLWDVPKRVRKDRIELLLDKFGLQDARKTKPPELSIGQRRRLQVAREFMHDSELLFLDEPTLGLDPQARRVTLDYVREKTKEGVTIFFTTHVMEEAEYVCDRIAIIDHGKILALDTVDNIKQKFGGLSVIQLRVKESNLDLKRRLEKLADIEKVLVSADPEQPLKVYSKQINSALPKILDIITSNNLHLVDLRVKESSLEDVFIQMVKENAK
jgi:ABC-2 type transport system ATP-binding protein